MEGEGSSPLLSHSPWAGTSGESLDFTEPQCPPPESEFGLRLAGWMRPLPGMFNDWAWQPLSQVWPPLLAWPFFSHLFTEWVGARGEDRGQAAPLVLPGLPDRLEGGRTEQIS